MTDDHHRAYTRLTVLVDGRLADEGWRWVVLLSELLHAIGEGPLRTRGKAEFDLDLNEVLLDDGVTPLGPGQVVLGIRPGTEQHLLDRAVAAGCQAVVVATGAAAEPREGVVVLESDVAWTQLFVLVRTMLLASHDEAIDDSGPTSVHGLADAVAVMVGGSVVLYDRAHRVIAYAVQGHEIDHVRRDAILGRRTPDQWIRRFTIDRTAYQTYSEPGKVVRVADYAGLHTRLRIAVHTGNEVIGEISVAEGANPFPSHAEHALQRAARLAVPVMLRHRRAQDVERTTREHAVRQLLWEGVLSAHTFGDRQEAHEVLVLGFGLHSEPEPRSGPSDELVSERFVHFLSLHLGTIEPAALVAQLDGVYWAVVPAGEATAERLAKSAGAALGHLGLMGVRANAALGPRAVRPDMVPAAKRIVEDLLAAARSAGGNGRVMTPDSSWAELVLAAACRGLAEGGVSRGPIEALVEHDRRSDSDLVGTLAVFLDEFGSVSASASRLFLHPNTLRHRIQRITEVSGFDFNDSNQRLAAAIVLRGAHIEKPRSAES
ncbi:helix-turn-helix domain-containing protein [Actinomadura vinacea]|uniref:Helix-turn-helix domain-containing protein n=1 Tax=Actinomadura vinacea TaxID=115336 RepID=A0ABN3ID04_9ACTN